MCTNIFNGHSKNKTIKNLNRGTLIVDISIPRNHVVLGENPNLGVVLIIHHLSVRTTSDDPQALQPLATCIWLLSIAEDLTVSYILVPRHIEPSWSRAEKFLPQSTKRYYWRRCLRHLPQMLAACITILTSRTRCAQQHTNDKSVVGVTKWLLVGFDTYSQRRIHIWNIILDQRFYKEATAIVLINRHDITI